MSLVWLCGGRPERGYSSIGPVDRDQPCLQGKGRGISFWLLLVPSAVVAALLLLLLGGARSDVPLPLLRSSAAPPAIPFSYRAHPMSPTSYWGSVTMPYPTGAFWTNLVIADGDGAAGVLPYGVKCLPAGVQVSYGAARRVMEPLSITDSFMPDIQIAAVESYVSRGVSAYDNASVTMGFAVDGGSYSAPLVKGSPFVTVVFQNATPSISSDLMIIDDVQSLDLPAGVTGSLRLVTLGNFLKWLVYCSSAAPLQVEGAVPARRLTTAGRVSAVVRAAVVPLGNEQQSVAALLSSLRTYPVGVDVKVDTQSASSALLKFEYRTVSVPAESSDELLMLALPHQVSIFAKNTPIVLNTSEYGPCFSMKGVMRPVRGKVWSLNYDLVSVGWTYNTEESSFPTSELNAIAVALSGELNGTQPQPDPDPYGFGKEVSRMANLALVADFLGIPEARKAALSLLESLLQPWVAVSNADYLVFDDTWGGVVSSEGLQNSQADFGNGWYNDHHFHYGYIIYAGAVLAHLQHDVFDASYKAFFDTLIRDICNSNPDDLSFPFARHKDLFDGHSWASGLFQQANGKSQESSSEAVNAYFGCYLYGMATENSKLTSFSHLLLSMEIQAAKQYWHMGNSDIYDPQFAANRMAGVVGSMSVTASTWFGDEPEYVHGINIMPVNAVTDQLFDSTFASKQWPILYDRLPSEKKYNPICSANPACASLGMTGDCCPSVGGVNLACCSSGVSGSTISGEFQALIYADQALVDKSLAWNEFISLQESPGVGASRSNYLLWTASRMSTKQNNMTHSKMKHFVEKEEDSRHVRAACSANSACGAVGIFSGMCCPTTDGHMLGCCPQSSH